MPSMSLGNGYSIDMSDGWTFVHALQHALDDLEAAWREHGYDLQNVPPPGRDGHSGHFAGDINAKLDSHAQWVSDQRKFLKNMLDSAKQMLTQYGVAETENTVKWNESGGSMPPAPHLGGSRAI